jgi:DNA-binding winged helix-turn-helix (wHTH) protein
MTEHKCLVFSFANVKVREHEFCIVKDDEVLAVEPKAFRVLLFLLRNPHILIPKEELLDAVWNDCTVSQNSLTRSIALLRRLLGDDTREPRYIATVPTVGYRFLCDVEVTEDGAIRLGAAENGLPTVEAGVSAETDTQRDQSSAERNRRARDRILAGIGVALIAALLTAFLLHRAVSNRGSAPGQIRFSKPTSSRMRVVQLTNLPGVYSCPAFSPNGEQIAFVWDGENPVRGDLYVQFVGGDRPLRLTHTRSGFVCCADWSPDGREIAFGRCDDNGGGVFIVPLSVVPDAK